MYGSFPPLSSDKHTRGKNQWSKSKVCTRLYWTKAKETFFLCVIFYYSVCVLLLLHFGFLLLKVYETVNRKLVCVFVTFSVMFCSFRQLFEEKSSFQFFHDEIPVVCTVNTILWWIMNNNNNRVVRREKKKYNMTHHWLCCVCAMKF